MNAQKFEEREVQLLKSAIQFFFRHIRFDESTVSRMSDNDTFQLFDERQYHGGKRRKVDHVLIDSVYETTETHIATFILSILHQGLFSVTSLVIAIIYLSRFKEVTRVSLHTYTWRLLFLAALLVADKANEDRPIKNGSLVKLFPVVTAEELNRLELTLVLKVRFAIFIKSELFYSFLDKLNNEKVSHEISSIVNKSDFARHQLLPAMKTVPSTPEPVLALNFKTPSTFRESQRKDQLDQSTCLGTPRRLMSQTVAPVLIESSGIRRGRSHSISRRNSSSFLDEDNSLEYSRTSSRRHSLGRPNNVPPPPIFEPMKYQGHPRRMSLGRTPRDPISETGHSTLSAINPIAAKVSPRSYSFIRSGSQRRPLTIGNNRWNNMF